MDNFIVSARKYRPATFASVVGQSHITSTLRNAIARRQLAVSYTHLTLPTTERV